MRRWVRVVLVLALVAGLGLVAFVVQPRSEAESRQEAFIRSLVSAAQRNQRQTGIPASVAIGQAALETGWGRSSMAAPPLNTLFNIKCTSKPSPYQTGCADVPSYEYRPDGSRYMLTSSFRTYASTGDSLLDYGRLLTSAKRYAPAFNHKNNPDEFIRAVARGGYATDPKYADLVISIMKRYNLYQYDVGGPSQKQPSAPVGVEDWRPGSAPSGGRVRDVQFVDGAAYPAYARGMKEPGVATLQHLLNQRAGARLSADGRFGARTDEAVRAWQNRSGLKPTGVMDDPSWNALLPRLGPGDKGAAVSALQTELRQHGQSVRVTGQFDSQTVAAVKKLQDQHKIRPDGKVGPTLWARLLDW